MRWLRWSGWAFGSLALLALLGAAAHLGDIERFVAMARSLAPSWLLVAILLQLGTYASLAAAWRYGLRRAGASVALRPLLALAVSKLFVDQTVPIGGLGGTAFVLAALARLGVPAATALSALLPALVGYYGAYLLAALLAVALLALAGDVRAWMMVLAGVFALVCAAIPACVLLLRRRGPSSERWLARMPGIASALAAVAAAPSALLRDARVLARMTSAGLCMFLFDAATLWVMLHALGLQAGFGAAFTSLVFAMMVATLGPIPLGLGSFEAMCVGMLVLQGVPIEGALTATLLHRGATTWAPMLPGFVLARHELRSPAAAAPSAERGETGTAAR